jgi:hypothetical protein
MALINDGERTISLAPLVPREVRYFIKLGLRGKLRPSGDSSQ